MWTIYDELIASVPPDSVVSGYLAGLSWFLVRSTGVGAAMRPREDWGTLPESSRTTGIKTRDLACWIKSWDWYEAALGLAAVNSHLNAPTTLQRAWGSLSDPNASEDVFTRVLDDLRGKKVAVVGHFFNLQRIAAVCELSIFERRPGPGDLPDPACEYILGEQDVVIITGSALINKTLPRLLELSRQARVIVAGPSTPLTPILMEHGVELLGGLVVHDEDLVWRMVGQGGRHELFDHGSRMVTFSRTSFRRNPTFPVSS
ncbi:MAG TPA: DUF364 domain-containing protein [Candidatus Acidoferrum sp.]|nr:DUF364 domain-containing protein [Candidatus Acidoferrum sp.]